jgi:glutamate/tyrosine decarboxylase-like PLP-dependent enzyme
MIDVVEGPGEATEEDTRRARTCGCVDDEPDSSGDACGGGTALDGATREAGIDDLIRSAFLYRPVSAEQRMVVHRALELGLRFLDGSIREARPLVHRTASELRSFASSPMPKTGTPVEQLLRELNELARFSIAQCDPAYPAFPDVGNSVAGLVGDVLAACLNQNMIAVDRSAPVASYVEAQLILWLRELVGFDTYELADLPNLAELGGMWTSGGNMSNHVAMVAALQHRFPDVAHDGLVGLGRKPVVVLARGVEHFSYAAAAQVLGLGRDALVWTAADVDFTTYVGALDRTLATLPDDVEPVMVVAVAGNCRTTGIDDLRAIASVCQARKVWLHVDACHGGSLLVSRSLRHLVDGIELADSVSLDPHKGLFTTYACSFVLFRDPSVLARFARYPERVHETGCLDLGLVTPFYGSRRFESLKLWLLVKHLGLDGLDEVVSARHRTFLHLVEVVDALGHFTRLNDPSFYRAALVFLPARLRRRLREVVEVTGDAASARRLIDDYTSRFSDSLYRDGRVVLDHFALQDLGDRLGWGPEHKYQTIGLALGHPVLSEDTVGHIRNVLDEVASPLADQMVDAVETLAATPDPGSRTAGLGGPAGW